MRIALALPATDEDEKRVGQTICQQCEGIDEEIDAMIGEGQSRIDDNECLGGNTQHSACRIPISRRVERVVERIRDDRHRRSVVVRAAPVDLRQERLGQ